MAICKAIVTQNEGEIEVYSDGLDCGTTFIFSMKMESTPNDEIERALIDEVFEESKSEYL